MDLRWAQGLQGAVQGVDRCRGVRKFMYESLANGQALVRTEYAPAHEKPVDALSRAGMPYTVVRPTGLYTFFPEILRMAQKNRGVVECDGSARTNPIHEADAARACADALNSGALTDMPSTQARRRRIAIRLSRPRVQPPAS